MMTSFRMFAMVCLVSLAVINLVESRSQPIDKVMKDPSSSPSRCSDDCEPKPSIDAVELRDHLFFPSCCPKWVDPLTITQEKYPNFCQLKANNDSWTGRHCTTCICVDNKITCLGKCPSMEIFPQYYDIPGILPECCYKVNYDKMLQEMDLCGEGREIGKTYEDHKDCTSCDCSIRGYGCVPMCGLIYANGEEYVEGPECCKKVYPNIYNITKLEELDVCGEGRKVGRTYEDYKECSSCDCTSTGNQCWALCRHGVDFVERPECCDFTTMDDETIKKMDELGVCGKGRKVGETYEDHKECKRCDCTVGGYSCVSLCSPVIVDGVQKIEGPECCHKK